MSERHELGNARATMGPLLSLLGGGQTAMPDDGARRPVPGSLRRTRFVGGRLRVLSAGSQREER